MARGRLAPMRSPIPTASRVAAAAAAAGSVRRGARGAVGMAGGALVAQTPVVEAHRRGLRPQQQWIGIANAVKGAHSLMLSLRVGLLGKVESL